MTAHVLDVLNSWPWLTAREVAEELHARLKHVQAILRRLFRSGRIGARRSPRTVVVCRPRHTRHLLVWEYLGPAHLEKA